MFGHLQFKSGCDHAPSRETYSEAGEITNRQNQDGSTRQGHPGYLHDSSLDLNLIQVTPSGK